MDLAAGAFHAPYVTVLGTLRVPDIPHAERAEYNYHASQASSSTTIFVFV